MASRKFATLKVDRADLEALRDALATGEGVAAAAATIAACPEVETTLISSPSGFTFRPEADLPVKFLWPSLTPDGDVAIPVVLRWYKTPKITEARGSREQAQRLVGLLQELLDAW